MSFLIILAVLVIILVSHAHMIKDMRRQIEKIEEPIKPERWLLFWSLTSIASLAIGLITFCILGIVYLIFYPPSY